MEFLQNILASLVALSAFLEPSLLPKEPNADWKVTQLWQAEGPHYIFEATSSTLIDRCRSLPNGHVQFSTVDQGVHEIYLDGKLIQFFGDKSFQTVRSYYGAPNVSCSVIAEGKELTWKVYSPAKIFAYLRSFPVLVEGSTSRYNAIAESLNAIVGGCLLVMGLFTLVVFFGKLSHEMSATLSASCIAFALYFGGTSTAALGIDVPMLPLHRLTETCLWLGISAYFYALHLHGFKGSEVFIKLGLPIIGFSVIWILLAPDSHYIQTASFIPMFPTVAMGLWIVVPKVRDLIFENFSRRRLFEVLSLSSFLFLSAHDALVTNGFIQGYMMMGVGMVCGMFFFAMSLNEKINHTYRERDYLREHLEEEVQIKTKELRNKTGALEVAMSELKEAQAELVQSARLASLGTLSAGIAHEINNSLNYVYGSLKPLEKLVSDHPDEEKRGKILKLTALMNDGLKLTFEIIKSLRNYTGLNQAKFNDLNIKEVIESVLTLLRSKMTENVKTTVHVSPELKVFGSVVGLNQMFMNLITNAMGAMPNGGDLRISAEQFESIVTIRISDTGQGIPAEIRDRLFEPFFTTKEVGKGSGLGLYIVKREIERHKGKITVESEVGHGATFVIELPATEVKERKLAA